MNNFWAWYSILRYKYYIISLPDFDRTHYLKPKGILRCQIKTKIAFYYICEKLSESPKLKFICTFISLHKLLIKFDQTIEDFITN